MSTAESNDSRSLFPIAEKYYGNLWLSLAYSYL